MKIKIIKFIFLFNLFFISYTYTLSYDNSAIKTMLLINDANKIIPNKDPYAIVNILTKVKEKMEDVSFKNLNYIQLIQIFNLITENIDTSQQSVQLVLFDLLKLIIDKIQNSLIYFSKNEELKKLLLSFINKIQKTFPEIKTKKRNMILKFKKDLENISYNLS
ncbi:hypothetical protein GF385_04125 [Candidatus Dependentiae bacterium]|nr:hypothetical protein [Candidatus Dependentiae bacterium]